MALEKVINSLLFYRCSVRLSERVQFFDQELDATTTTDLSNEETLTEGDDDVFTRCPISEDTDQAVGASEEQDSATPPLPKRILR